jgi:SAM-dependent methyltransferase
MSSKGFSSDLEQSFSAKYDADLSDWGGSSGPGSDPFYNLSYRGFLESFIVLNRIRSIIDIGCGDWQFSKFLCLNGVNYLGLDIVGALIEENSRRYGGQNIRFRKMPGNKRDLPPANLLVMKDVLQHLPNAEIMDFHRTVFGKFQYCLITNSYRKLETGTNHDILPGEFRCLDLKAPPFSFPGAYVLQFSTGVWEEIRTLLITNVPA